MYLTQSFSRYRLLGIAVSIGSLAFKSTFQNKISLICFYLHCVITHVINVDLWQLYYRALNGIYFFHVLWAWFTETSVHLISSCSSSFIDVNYLLGKQTSFAKFAVKRRELSISCTFCELISGCILKFYQNLFTKNAVADCARAILKLVVRVGKTICISGFQASSLDCKSSFSVNIISSL